MSVQSLSPRSHQALTLLGILTLFGFGAVLGIGALLAATVFGWPIITQLNTLFAGNLNWYAIRGTGIVGYLLLTMATVWGLLLSSKIIKETVSPVLALGMHNYLSWNALLLIAVHAVLLLFNGWFDYRVWHLIVPFTGPYRPLWVGFGVLSFWGMVVVTLSFYVKKRIGQRTWRWLHYSTFALFIFSALHGAFAGTDWAMMGAVYIGSIALVTLLTLYRVGDAVLRRMKRRKQ